MLDSRIPGQLASKRITLPAGFLQQSVPVHLISRAFDCDRQQLLALADFAGSTIDRPWADCVDTGLLLKVHFFLAMFTSGNLDNWDRDAQFGLIAYLALMLGNDPNRAGQVNPDQLCEEFADDWDNDDLRERHAHTARTFRSSLLWVRWLQRRLDVIATTIWSGANY